MVRSTVVALGGLTKVELFPVNLKCYLLSSSQGVCRCAICKQKQDVSKNGDIFHDDFSLICNGVQCNKGCNPLSL